MESIMSQKSLFASNSLKLMLPAMLLVLVAAALPGCSGCSREKPEPILDRSEDPAYIAELKKQRETQRDIAKRLNKVRVELEAARAENPESEETKALEKQVKDITIELEKNRIQSMNIVRSRIQQEEKDRAAAGAK